MRLVLSLTALLLLAMPIAHSASINKVARTKSIRHFLTAAAVSLTILTSAPSVTADDGAADDVEVGQEQVADVDAVGDEPVWFELKSTPLAHRQAVFYLLIDLFDNWRVIHVNYVGDDHDGEPLFVGLRTYTRFGDDPVFRFAVSALVGHEGLVQENINVEEVAFFPSNATTPYFDITLLKIHDLDMSAYEPIQMTNHVELLADVEMLSYRIDLAANLLEFFDYPLRYRQCESGKMTSVQQQTMMTNNCSIPYTPAVTGSPIFSDKHELLGLYVGWLDEERHLAITMPKVLLDLNAFAVDKKDKLPTLWGQLKK